MHKAARKAKIGQPFILFIQDYFIFFGSVFNVCNRLYLIQ